MAIMNGTLSTWMYENPAYSVKGSLPFELGKTYKRRDGRDVTIIEVNNEMKGYETVQGDDAESPRLGWRYNRESCRGRCTGSLAIDPSNLLPEFPADHPTKGEGFLVPVSLLGANRTAEERALFRALLMVQSEMDDQVRSARERNTWETAEATLFNHGLKLRAETLIASLGLQFNHHDNPADKKRKVLQFWHDFEFFIEDKRPFYAA